MGLDLSTYTAFLLAIKQTRTGNALTLGRQGIHMPFEMFKNISVQYGFDFTYNEYDQYCEKILMRIGFGKVDSIDKSPFEGATIIHDMNKPIEVSNKYDMIFDGGTIEHIFNTPQLFENIINLLEIGGIFCSVTVNNNFSGHGFYQFSPELFYRMFSAKYGMKLIKVYLAVVNTHFEQWKEIDFTSDSKYRFDFKFGGSDPVYIITYAEKISDTRESLVYTSPQQFSYEEIDWKK
jgi:SAM-dependent methyltransferase